MIERNDERAAGALLDFLELYQADLAAGVVRTSREYESRFPGFEAGIRAEFARLQARDAGQASSTETDALSLADHSALLEHLRKKLAAPDRYQQGVEIGRGATSRVYLAQDLELVRQVAMKVHEGPRQAVLWRFVREARVIGRLDHPGIVPVHDLGLTRDGRVFFTMRLIRGKSLKDLLHEEELRTDPSLRRRFLEAVVRVCDTLAFAHARGVVHRDIKPSNVMIGAYGEVYVVDWGLARIGAEERATPPGAADGSPLETLAGQVLGTPAYMSPEQARGDPDSVGPRSDVYSVGSILYHYLCGHAPFCEGGSAPSSSAVLERIAAGIPPVLDASARALEPELASICARAMARDPRDRYASGSDLASDLRAFLDGRAVHAHGRSWPYRIEKWIRRNRAVTVGLLLALGLTFVALRSTREAHARSTDLRFLADLRGPLQLMDEIETLWPATPEHKAAIAGWIRKAEDLRMRADEYECELERLRRTGGRLPVEPIAQEDHARRREMQIVAAERALDQTGGMLIARERGETSEGPTVEKLRSDVASLERAVKAARARPVVPESQAFADAETQLRHDRLEAFLAELDFVVGREAPRQRLLLARAALEVADKTEEAGPITWEEARAAVLGCPRYSGLDLRPQRGLVPLGPDPLSGLWEFAHVQSGCVPVRGTDGGLVIDGDSAIVLVLVPGGHCEVGAQATDPSASLYDPHADRHELPRLSLELAPFFLSKYELTLGQWCRMTGDSPELYFQGTGEDYRTLNMPAFGASGEWAKVVVAAYGLELPTSVAWEHAARAGTTTIWWCGNTLASLEGCGNVADTLWVRATNAQQPDVAGAVPFDDGYGGLAPVGIFRPNAFGLHDTIGNVSEWCRDVTIPYMEACYSDTLELARKSFGLQIIRGGYAAEGAFGARSSAREYVQPTAAFWNVGIRPSRRLDP